MFELKGQQQQQQQKKEQTKMLTKYWYPLQQFRNVIIYD